MNLDKLWAILNNAISNANVTGALDGVAFQDISFAASGYRAFIVKGWVDTNEGPAVRYRADWNDLDSGEVFYQVHPSAKGWQETREERFKLERGEGNILIVMSFRTADDIKHNVKFTADINMGSIFESFLSP